MDSRTRSGKLFPILKGPVRYSIRKLAELTGISKSATHRHKRAIEERNLYPESHLWETPEGYEWLRRLFVAVIFVFAIKNGIGGGTISEFYRMLRLEKAFGVSPSTIKDNINKVQELLVDYEREQQSQAVSGKTRKVVGGVDETFFDRMVLVFMDLPSGFIFVEEASDDRSYETWKDRVYRAISDYGLKIRYLVSDRAKGLIKLAETGIGCLSIPDLFHASHEVVKLFGLSLKRKMSAIEKELAKATVTLTLLKELGEDITTQEMLVSDLETKLCQIESGLSGYQNILHALSKIVHPFDINNSSRQSSAFVERLLHRLVEEIRQLQQAYEIGDSKNHIGKFSKQITGIASIVDAWWLWAEESLDSEEITEETKQRLLTCLLADDLLAPASRKNKKLRFKGELSVCSGEGSVSVRRAPPYFFIDARAEVVIMG